jgi:hypothetical protein
VLEDGPRHPKMIGSPDRVASIAGMNAPSYLGEHGYRNGVDGPLHRRRLDQAWATIV